MSGEPRDTLAAAAQEAIAALRDRAEFAEAILDHVAHPIFVKDRSFRFVLVNRALCALVGIERQVMLGQDDYAFFPREQADFFRQKDLEMFVARAPVVIEEEPITDAAGGEHWLATTKVPLVNASGRVTHVVGIIHDITQLRAAQRELQAANQELEAYGYSVSHDLHAPLRSIRGFARALAEDVGADLPANSRAHLDRILAATERMSALIDQILQLSRVGRAEIARQAVDLGAIARDVVVECRAAEPSRQVEVDIAAPLPCSADPVLARILVQNLVGNAWKFTRDAPAARIEFWRDAQGRFTVRDNGAGFPPGAASRLFRPFQRLHGASEFPGTGLGLASVRRIVERHGGQVGASSTPGHGAAFWFTLPAGVGALAS